LLGGFGKEKKGFREMRTSKRLSLDNIGKRKWIDRSMKFLFVLAAFLALLPLGAIFFYLLYKGAPGLDLNFFTSMPQPVGVDGGGMANAILGSFLIVGVAAFFGIPWGLSVGVFLSEFGNTQLARVIRFISDLLTSVPSIIVGLFAYALLVRPMGGFSAYAGSAALAMIMLPFIARSTEEILRLVPSHVREAGLALGIPRWRVTLFIVLRGSFKGVTTALILAVARVAGETAPLLFTSFNNRFWSMRLDQPMASLPVQIYTYATGPFQDWHQQAWTGALVLVFSVFLLNLLTRLVFSFRFR
jgi:phosphate transport system permease protein